MSLCPHDPKALLGQPIGMYHCPECGQMVLAGMDHPDYDTPITEEDIAILDGRACHWPRRPDPQEDDDDDDVPLHSLW